MAGFSHRSPAKYAVVRCMLGPLEREVMEILWSAGECSVRDVLRQMERPAAYTTVMTTLVRLHGKGVLKQSKQERAFRYAPLVTAEEMEVRIATDLINRFLSGPRAQRAALGSSLLMAIAELDESLLEELEQAMRRKRIELAGRKSAAGPGRESQEPNHPAIIRARKCLSSRVVYFSVCVHSQLVRARRRKGLSCPRGQALELCK